MIKRVKVGKNYMTTIMFDNFQMKIIEIPKTSDAQYFRLDIINLNIFAVSGLIDNKSSGKYVLTEIKLAMLKLAKEIIKESKNLK